MDLLLGLLNSIPLARAILGFILVLFLPGFAWTLVFFRKLHHLERIALSFGLSIAIVTLSIIALNVLFHIPISGFNSLMTILVITIAPLPIYYLLKRFRKPMDAPPESEE